MSGFFSNLGVDLLVDGLLLFLVMLAILVAGLKRSVFVGMLFFAMLVVQVGAMAPKKGLFKKPAGAGPRPGRPPAVTKRPALLLQVAGVSAPKPLKKNKVQAEEVGPWLELPRDNAALSAGFFSSPGIFIETMANDSNGIMLGHYLIKVLEATVQADLSFLVEGLFCGSSTPALSEWFSRALKGRFCFHLCAGQSSCLYRRPGYMVFHVNKLRRRVGVPQLKWFTNKEFGEPLTAQGPVLGVAGGAPLFELGRPERAAGEVGIMVQVRDVLEQGALAPATGAASDGAATPVVEPGAAPPLSEEAIERRVQLRRKLGEAKDKMARQAEKLGLSFTEQLRVKIDDELKTVQIEAERGRRRRASRRRSRSTAKRRGRKHSDSEGSASASSSSESEEELQVFRSARGSSETMVEVARRIPGALLKPSLRKMQSYLTSRRLAPEDIELEPVATVFL